MKTLIAIFLTFVASEALADKGTSRTGENIPTPITNGLTATTYVSGNTMIKLVNSYYDPSSFPTLAIEVVTEDPGQESFSIGNEATVNGAEIY